MPTTVGYPCAVNPDHRLRRHAGQHDWPIVDFRTGVRLLRVALPGAAAVGAGAGVAAAAAVSRRASKHAESGHEGA
jgi:hypothetical protein